MMSFGLAPAAHAQAAVTEQEAHAIGVDAYLYFYPLVTMDITRKQSTNVEPGKELGKGPMNMFANVADLSTCRFQGSSCGRTSTRSIPVAWLDLTKEPMVVSVPDTGRPLLPAADARHVDRRVRFARLAHHRHRGRQFPVVAAGLEAGDRSPTAGSDQRIDAPTPYVWIIGRTKTDGPADYDAVHKIQAGYKITPLSQWGKPPQPPGGQDRPDVST